MTKKKKARRAAQHQQRTAEVHVHGAQSDNCSRDVSFSMQAGRCHKHGGVRVRWHVGSNVSDALNSRLLARWNVSAPFTPPDTFLAWCRNRLRFGPLPLAACTQGVSPHLFTHSQMRCRLQLRLPVPGGANGLADTPPSASKHPLSPRVLHNQNPVVQKSFRWNRADPQAPSPLASA